MPRDKNGTSLQMIFIYCYKFTNLSLENLDLSLEACDTRLENEFSRDEDLSRVNDVCLDPPALRRDVDE